MITHEEHQKLKGMKFIRYKGTDQDHAWKFMLDLNLRLQEENKQLRERVDELTKRSAIDTSTTKSDNSERP